MTEISLNCTGCRACEQLCPQNCISMQTDEEGFLVPIIDEIKCTDCGLCRKRCPSNSKAINQDKTPTVYAAKLNDKEILMKSTSGGIFAGIALLVLAEGGYVFGAAYDENLVVGHICIDSEQDLHKLQGSKYVQSDTKDTYSQVKKLLGTGKKVVYSGTPCQIAGLNAFLGKNYDNLLTVDLICHGVPSPLVFKKYLGWLEKKKRSKVIDYTFRIKKHGWGTNYNRYVANKEYSILSSIDAFGINFGKANMFRRCCYSCDYAKINRMSDITLGDYWGIEKAHPNFFDKLGVSVILINTDKGLAFFDKLSPSLTYVKSDVSKAVEGNPRLIKPSLTPPVRNVIYNHINEWSDYDYVQKNLMPSITLKIKTRALIPPKLKKVVKTVLKKK